MLRGCDSPSQGPFTKVPLPHTINKAFTSLSWYTSVTSTICLSAADGICKGYNVTEKDATELLKQEIYSTDN
jgi:hypothetical protein